MKTKWPAFAQVIGKSVVDWYDAWVDYEVITLLWLVAQVTVLFGPPLTFGIYYALNVQIRTGENIGINGVLEGTKKYFWRGWAWGVMNWAVLIIGAIDLAFYVPDTTFGYLMRLFVTLIVAFWFISQLYVPPFFMAQEQEKLLLAIRNSFFLVMSTPFFTLGILVFTVIVIALSGVLIVPALLGFPMLIMIFGTRALYNRLEALGLRKKAVEPKEAG